MGTSVEKIVEEIKGLYLSDSMPWVVGYSGGKDSTASLQLIWLALSELSPGDRTKPVHVISTDTLVENPVIASWVEASLDHIGKAAKAQGLPIEAHRLTPALNDRFWVNLIGRGYPSPRARFRWCTDRLKISASTQFIQDLSTTSGEAILVLGQRRGESSARDKVMDNYKGSTRDRLSRNKDPKLSRVWVYLPIETWTSDDVWEYIITQPNPWGIDNQELFSIYRGATPDAECPIVVDTTTPSCGDSRFGCYVCTMVTQDKSMQAMLQNDEQKRWMQPILDFRNEYLAVEDRHLRDFRRMNGKLTVYNGRLVHGPYIQSYRETLLRELLSAQRTVQKAAKEQGLRSVELIGLDELDEIRKIWLEDKGEIEDRLPTIYEEIFGGPYPGKAVEPMPLDSDDLQLLREIAAEVDPEAAEELYRLTRNLSTTRRTIGDTKKRSHQLDVVDEVLTRFCFRNEEEALEFALHTPPTEIVEVCTQPDPSDPEVEPEIGMAV
jgi:DNA sulfur modification protein DndC